MSTTGDRTSKMRALILALIYGVLSEAALCAVFQRSGRIIDNGNAVGFLTYFFHLPGIMIAALLRVGTPGQDYMFYPVVMIFGAAEFSLLYWCLIKLWTRKYGRKSN